MAESNLGGIIKEFIVNEFLPGENPVLRQFADRLGIPADAVSAGAETMYPEFKAKLRRPQ